MTDNEYIALLIVQALYLVVLGTWGFKKILDNVGADEDE